MEVAVRLQLQPPYNVKWKHLLWPRVWVVVRMSSWLEYKTKGFESSGSVVDWAIMFVKVEGLNFEPRRQGWHERLNA
jgi:hypothetical protein